MAQAARDQNFVTSLLGVSSIDFDSPLPVTVAVNPATHAMLVEASVTLAANSSVNVNQWGGISTTLGQKAMAASLPVTIASDQSAIPVSGTFFQATQPVSGTVTATQGTSPWVNNITQIGGSSISLGQALAAASLPVVLTAAQITTLTPPAAITGFATEATLASIKDTAGIKKITDALPAGTNNIGDVDVLTLPSIPTGSNTIGNVGIVEGGTQAEVNARTDGIIALEVADDMTSGETFRQALVASTDTTITFSQAVRLVRIKNESLTASVFVRDGAISSDTPANAEMVGVAPVLNLPTVEYYPFKTTTIHLRSAGTPSVSVTGFY